MPRLGALDLVTVEELEVAEPFDPPDLLILGPPLLYRTGRTVWSSCPWGAFAGGLGGVLVAEGLPIVSPVYAVRLGYVVGRWGIRLSRL